MQVPPNLLPQLLNLPIHIFTSVHPLIPQSPKMPPIHLHSGDSSLPTHLEPMIAVSIKLLSSALRPVVMDIAMDAEVL